MTGKDSLRWWPHNFLQSGDGFDQFWQSYLHAGDRNILFILGKGFDSRMNCGIEKILGFKERLKLTCMMINIQEGEFSPSRAYLHEVEDNYCKLKKLLEDRCDLIEEDLAMLKDTRRVGGRKAAVLFTDENLLLPYTDVVVDISAMPRNIYFPLIKQIDNLIQNMVHKGLGKNLHVIVAEEFIRDIRIRQELDENASYMFSFSGGMELEGNADTPIIWFPILGEGKQEQLDIVYKLLEISVKNKEIEICPVIPFPARNPRRGDDLIVQYHEFFERHEVESRNIIFADEQNPFDVYRQICNAAMHYEEALKPLEGCRNIISAMSSKLLSIGALIAAKERDMAVAFVGAQGYSLDEESNNQLLDVEWELFEVWVSGEPYC